MTAQSFDKYSSVSRRNKNWLDRSQIDMEQLIALLSNRIDKSSVPLAADLVQQVPVYNAKTLRSRLAEELPGDFLRELQSEWKWVWESGPGILVIQGAFCDELTMDQVNQVFAELIQSEKDSGLAAGDHFAKPGANNRVWNALEKLCLYKPQLFARYYSNELLAYAAEAWLGPAYQITSQVNCVNPGGLAQVAHRDYHLGFMTPEHAERYPEQVHRLSPLLTLQCAIAQVDMPLESGPTLYLPHSQKYAQGYLLADHKPFHDYFAKHRIQLALKRGDLVMFNPALIHAAGSNTSQDIQRLANLLQISSAFGRSLESVDRLTMSKVLYPELAELKANGELSEIALDCAIAACAEGYPFPTNLDRDPPIGGLAPPSQAAHFRTALSENWSAEQFNAKIDLQAQWRG